MIMVSLPLLQQKPLFNALQRKDFASRAVTVISATDSSKPFEVVSENARTRGGNNGLDAWQHEKLEAYASKSKKKLEVRLQA